jgi:hypothetical protein
VSHKGSAILLLTGGIGPLTVAISNDILANAGRSGLGAAAGLMAFMAVKVSLLLSAVFWISRLFKAFSQGIFFGAPAITCFVWLGWLYFMDFLLDQALSVYAYYFLEYEDISLDIRMGQVCMMVLLLIVVHILRVASRL